MKETLMCLDSAPVTDVQGWSVVFSDCGICSAPAIHIVSAKYGVISSTVKKHRSKKQGVKMWVDSLKAIINNLF